MFTVNNRRQINTGVHPIYEKHFNFDLEEIKTSLASPSVTPPDEAMESVEAFTNWLMSEDFNDE